ncbi:MAG: VWA domain-containing protein [Planctomycetota bacterium]
MALVELWGISLLDPWLLLALPLLVVAVCVRARRPRNCLPTASAALFRGLPRTMRERLAFVPQLLKVLACLCLVVALARPVLRQIVPLREEGIDIALVVDVSSSMVQEDMRRNEAYRRIDAARDRAVEFGEARVHDRVALIAFSRFAELRCPLTLDEEALAAFLRVLDTVPQGSAFDGTAIGTALAKAVQVLEDSDAASKVVVLLSDGENNDPRSLPDQVLPEDAARLASDAGLRVHTIGLGKGVPNMLGRMQPLTFDSLRMIAGATGGEFFAADSDEDLGAVYARIDELEKTERDDPRYRTVDRFEWPLAVGLVLLLLAILVEAVAIRRVP